jgi:hypothetical protein
MAGRLDPKNQPMREFDGPGARRASEKRFSRAPETKIDGVKTRIKWMASALFFRREIN